MGGARDRQLRKQGCIWIFVQGSQSSQLRHCWWSRSAYLARASLKSQSVHELRSPRGITSSFEKSEDETLPLPMFWQFISGDISRGRIGTAITLLERLRTHYGRHCELLSGKNAPDCRILHVQSLTFFHAWYPKSPQKRPRCLDQDTNFRLARQRFRCSGFIYETTTDSFKKTQVLCVLNVCSVLVTFEYISVSRVNIKSVNENNQFTGRPTVQLSSA